MDYILNSMNPQTPTADAMKENIHCDNGCFMKVIAVILLLAFIGLILYGIMNRNIESERSESIESSEINNMDIEAQVVQCTAPQSAARSEQETGLNDGAGNSCDDKPIWNGPDSSPKLQPNATRLTTLELSLNEIAQNVEELFDSNQDP